MKRVLTLVLSLIIFVGCNQSKHPLPVKPTDSKAVETDSLVAKEAVDYSQFQNHPEHLDTIVGDWEIHARQFFDGKTIDYLDVKYANYPYRFQIKKKGKVVFDRLVITTKRLLQVDYKPDYLLNLTGVIRATATTVYIEMNCCIPDTDDMYDTLLAFSADKTFDFYNIYYYLGAEHLWSETDISMFYAMYAHELSLKNPNRQAIRQVLKAYCTPELAERAQHYTLQNNPFFGAGHFDAAWANTLEIDSVSGKTNVAELKYNKYTTNNAEVKRELKLTKTANDKYLISNVGQVVH